MTWVKLIIVSVIILSLAACIIYIFSRLNSPHQGTVDGAKVELTPLRAIGQDPKHAFGTYVSFNYPNKLNQVANDKLALPILEQFNYRYHDIESWHLAIDIMKNPGGNVTTMSDYKFRKTKPEIYKESTETLNGQKIVIMTDTSAGGFSKVAFLDSGTTAATISLTGDDPSGTNLLAKSFDMVLASWQWK